MRHLTIVSYNIHSGIGTDGCFDLPRVGRVLEEIGADIIALQEVGDFRGRTTHGDHPERLATLLGMQMAFGPNVVRDGRRYGNAVLSRLPLMRSKNYDLSIDSRESRGALRCDLDLGSGRALHVFCLHLGLRVRERRKQEGLLLSADILRDTVRRDPVIVCGDFNYWGVGRLPPLVRKALRDGAAVAGQRERTYPSLWPMFRLDRIFVDAGIDPLWVKTHRTALSKSASDHLPLVMRFLAPVEVLREGPGAPPVEVIT